MEGIVAENLRTLEDRLCDVIGGLSDWSIAYAADEEGKITYVGRYSTAPDRLRNFNQWGVMHGISEGQRIKINKLGGYDHPVLRETRRVFNRKYERYEKKEERENFYSTLTLGVEC